MNFKPFAQQVKDNFDSMSTKPLYRTNVVLDEIKDIYLAAFPAGTNPMYITNTQHDCTCCKSFIRNVIVNKFSQCLDRIKVFFNLVILDFDFDIKFFLQSNS